MKPLVLIQRLASGLITLLTAVVVSAPSLDGLTLTGGRLDAYALATAPAITIATPAAPSGLTATAGSRGVINLAWADVDPLSFLYLPLSAEPRCRRYSGREQEDSRGVSRPS